MNATPLKPHRRVMVWIFFVIVVILLLQNTLSEEIKIGALIPRTVRGFLELTLTNQIWLGIKILVLVPIVLTWFTDRIRLLRIALSLSLSLLTFELFASVSFLAFTTTTAFGPTDTLPLTQRAKLLMLLQALLSLIIIVVLAGRALSVLR